MNKVIRVTARLIRATYFMAHGQKAETWLPAGEYLRGAEVWLSTVENVRAVVLHGCGEKNKGTYYVRTDIDTQPGVEFVDVEAKAK